MRAQARLIKTRLTRRSTVQVSTYTHSTITDLYESSLKFNIILWFQDLEFEQNRDY